jgi:hypothetical protein
MRMFWEKSSRSANDSGNPLRAKLIAIFHEAANGDLFTLDDLTEITHAERADFVAFWLSELASAHVIDQFVSVISPKNSGGIDRFPSIEAVPPAIFDPFQMKEIEVSPNLIRVYFTKHQADDGGSTSVMT